MRLDVKVRHAQDTILSGSRGNTNRLLELQRQLFARSERVKGKLAASISESHPTNRV
jgi:hypothetical protein